MISNHLVSLPKLRRTSKRNEDVINLKLNYDTNKSLQTYVVRTEICEKLRCIGIPRNSPNPNYNFELNYKNKYIKQIIYRHKCKLRISDERNTLLKVRKLDERIITCNSKKPVSNKVLKDYLRESQMDLQSEFHNYVFPFAIKTVDLLSHLGNCNLEIFHNTSTNLNSNNNKIEENPLYSEPNNCIGILTGGTKFCNKIINSHVNKLQPIIYPNSRVYHYTNVIVQAVALGTHFSVELKSSDSVDSESINEDSLFFKNLFNLISALRNGNQDKIQNMLNVIPLKNNESSSGDDYFKCLMNILSRLDKVMLHEIKKNVEALFHPPDSGMSNSENVFQEILNKNTGFPCENFYGELKFKIVCKSCNHVCHESLQMVNSLILPPPNLNGPSTLQSCLDFFLNESDVTCDISMICKCEKGWSTNLKSITKITHCPRYLVLYLSRMPRNCAKEKNTNLKFEHFIYIETTESYNYYKLICVVDHRGDDIESFYHLNYNYEMEDWWILKDTKVGNMKKTETDKTALFLLEKM